MFIQREESMKTILLADDEANLRTLIRMTLEDPHYRILEATDGTAALQLARQERPDLVILDWMMPGPSGIAVARILRQEPSHYPYSYHYVDCQRPGGR